MTLFPRQICEKPYPLTGMRNHTKTAHGLQITKYKEIYGPFEILQVLLHITNNAPYSKSR